MQPKDFLMNIYNSDSVAHPNAVTQLDLYSLHA